MSSKSVQVLTNEIIDCATVPVWPDRPNNASMTFGVGPGAIYFTKENIDEFRSNLNLLYSKHKEIEDTYTLKEFETRFIAYFSENIRNNEKCNKEFAEKFLLDLLEIKKDNFTVFREIHGITIADPKNILFFGPFRVFNFHTNKAAITSISGAKLDRLFTGHEPDYLISVPVSARHYQKANEIADRLFEKFEKLLKFMIGYNSRRYQVGVLNHFGSKVENAYIIGSAGSLSSSHHVNGTHEKVSIDDPYFLDSKTGHAQLWKLLELPNNTSLQKRILLGAEWLGEAYNELSRASAFLKSAISLEIIFTFNEKSIITPSILSQISESTALLLGESAEERIKIEKLIKTLYAQRSAIAHAGQNNVDEQDLYDLYFAARAVICKILTHIDLNSISSIEQLYDLFKLKKYSSPAFIPLDIGP